MDTGHPPDSQLIAQLHQRQESALAILYDRYHRLVFSVALQVCRHQATAEEITLDVFNTLWVKVELYDAGKSKLSTWLTRLARNRAIDRLRREQVRPESSSVSWAEVSLEPLARGGQPEASLQQQLQRERVRRAIAQLTPEQQEVLGLAYYQGYSHSQMAEALDLPLGTVKGRVRAAMQRLRHLLADET